MKKIPLFLVLVALLAAVSYWSMHFLTGTIPGNGTTSWITSTPVLDPQEPRTPVPYRVEPFVTGLEVPWSIVFTSDTRMLVTERPGRIRVVENGQLREQPLKTVTEVSSRSEEGLMGMAIHPQYQENKWLYIAYAYQRQNQMVVKVVRFTDAGTELRDEKIIIDNLPAAQNHAGTRLRFGPDGKLYITTGDASRREIAQDQNNLGGKILRLNDDGSIPSDNPFSGSAVYSLGHRNSQGIDWHPVSGSLFSTEHGPSGFDGPGGGDEVNIIQAGENYGWPEVSHSESDPAYVDPLLVYTPAEAPASGMFYSGDIFPQFQNNFFFGALRGQGIVRIVVDEKNNNQVVINQKLEGIDVGRVREITQGPDGYIYFSSSNRDGRGTVRETDDVIYRLVPDTE
jgi:glucose/arabinose dehydrogenase